MRCLFCAVAEGQEDTILSYEPVIRQESKWFASSQFKKITFKNKNYDKMYAFFSE